MYMCSALPGSSDAVREHSELLFPKETDNEFYKKATSPSSNAISPSSQTGDYSINCCAQRPRQWKVALDLNGKMTGKPISNSRSTG